jgi:phage-related protein
VTKTVTLYATPDGKCQVREFLDALPGKVVQKITWVLTLLEDFDTVPSLYFKKLTGTDDIWECRIAYGSNIYRILCFFADASNIVLTNGFIKKSQKVPKTEIEKADAYRREFLNRRKKHD